MGGVMPFVAGGLALADFDVTEGGGIMSQSGGLFTGWTVGVGADVRFSDRVFGRAEVLYDDYGSKQYDTFTASLTGWTARVALILKLGP
jgi:outer membrane immunogenic protein